MTYLEKKIDGSDVAKRSSEIHGRGQISTPGKEGNNFCHHVIHSEMLKTFIFSITPPGSVYDNPDMMIWRDRGP